jgi:hypothetical protein
MAAETCRRRAFARARRLGRSAGRASPGGGLLWGGLLAAIGLIATLQPRAWAVSWPLVVLLVVAAAVPVSAAGLRAWRGRSKAEREAGSGQSEAGNASLEAAEAVQAEAVWPAPVGVPPGALPVSARPPASWTQAVQAAGGKLVEYSPERLVRYRWTPSNGPVTGELPVDCVLDLEARRIESRQGAERLAAPLEGSGAVVVRTARVRRLRTVGAGGILEAPFQSAHVVAGLGLLLLFLLAGTWGGFAAVGLLAAALALFGLADKSGAAALRAIAEAVLGLPAALRPGASEAYHARVLVLRPSGAELELARTGEHGDPDSAAAAALSLAGKVADAAGAPLYRQEDAADR